jgi:hypothetical protein
VQVLQECWLALGVLHCHRIHTALVPRCLLDPTPLVLAEHPLSVLLCSLGRRSFFTTTDEDQWQLIRKGTAQAFSQANIRWVECSLQLAVLKC